MTVHDCSTCRHAKPRAAFLNNLRCDKADKLGMLHDAFFWLNFGDCKQGEWWEARV